MRDIEKYTKDYNVPNFEDYQLQYRRKKIMECVNYYRPQNILEIGCGMEPLFKYIEYEFMSYTVIEPSEEFYKNAIDLSRNDNRISCYNMFYGEQNNLETTYDMIICSSLLHEVPDPDAFISAIKKNCNRNTVVHINVPNARSFHRLLAKEMGLIQDEHDMSERNILYQQREVFDIEKLRWLLETAGFKILQSGSYFIKPFSHSQMYEMIDKGIINESVLDGLYKMEKYMPDIGSEIYANAKLERLEEGSI